MCGLGPFPYPVMHIIGLGKHRGPIHTTIHDPLFFGFYYTFYRFPLSPHDTTRFGMRMMTIHCTFEGEKG